MQTLTCITCMRAGTRVGARVGTQTRMRAHTHTNTYPYTRSRKCTQRGTAHSRAGARKDTDSSHFESGDTVSQTESAAENLGHNAAAHASVAAHGTAACRPAAIAVSWPGRRGREREQTLPERCGRVPTEHDVGKHLLAHAHVVCDVGEPAVSTPQRQHAPPPACTVSGRPHIASLYRIKFVVPRGPWTSVSILHSLKFAGVRPQRFGGS